MLFATRGAKTNTLKPKGVSVGKAGAHARLLLAFLKLRRMGDLCLTTWYDLTCKSRSLLAEVDR